MTEQIKLWATLSPAQRDALIAQRVFGWQWIPAKAYGPHVKEGAAWLLPSNGLSGITSDLSAEWTDIGDGQFIPRHWVAYYSTDLNAAWTLLERFHSYQTVAVPKAKHFEVDVFAGNGKDTWGAVSHQSMQDAICIAVLRAVGVEVEA